VGFPDRPSPVSTLRLAEEGQCDDEDLSLDLRERAVAAVESGMSCRQAAARFGVGAASAARWCARARETGTPKSVAQGGDRRSQRIEAAHEIILGIVDRTGDITFVELQAELAVQGHRFSIGALWRFFARDGITWKKTAHATKEDRRDV
jgi:transposase